MIQTIPTAPTPTVTMHECPDYCWVGQPCPAGRCDVTPAPDQPAAGRHRTEAPMCGEVASWRAEAAAVRAQTDRAWIARRAR